MCVCVDRCHMVTTLPLLGIEDKACSTAIQLFAGRLSLFDPTRWNLTPTPRLSGV